MRVAGGDARPTNALGATAWKSEKNLTFYLPAGVALVHKLIIFRVG